MEELLNKLIEKGWKPRGENVELYGTSENTFGEKIVIFIGNAGGFKKWGGTYRELVSKESGLWQFVCDNGMIRVTEGNSLCNWLFGEEIYYDETQTDKLYKNDNYEYWIIESALCDEEDLEKFLLDNIKIS